MFPQGPEAYDRSITLFSPDGRLFQVEYAREAVKRGATALGIRYCSGVLLAVDKNITSKLLVSSSSQKLHKVDEHVVVATSGLVGDGRELVNTARLIATRNRLRYGELISIRSLTRMLSDKMQSYTQYSGARPYGISLLIAGVDTKSHLFDTDPSGAFNEYYGTAIGVGKSDVEKILEETSFKELKKADALNLAIKCLRAAADGKIRSSDIDVMIIGEGGEWLKLTEKELQTLMD